jgi:hypothetical protein
MSLRQGNFIVSRQQCSKGHFDNTRWKTNWGCSFLEIKFAIHQRFILLGALHLMERPRLNFFIQS